jgi:hypothetical protein
MQLMKWGLILFLWRTKEQVPTFFMCIAGQLLAASRLAGSNLDLILKPSEPYSNVAAQQADV